MTTTRYVCSMCRKDLDPQNARSKLSNDGWAICCVDCTPAIDWDMIEKTRGYDIPFFHCVECGETHGISASSTSTGQRTTGGKWCCVFCKTAISMHHTK